MNARERYLEEVAADLPLPAELRGEVLEELALHLGDTIDYLAAHGLGQAAAEAEAIARLGPPQALATDLARAQRRPTRVLAAAGAGARAAISAGTAGFLAASLVLVFVWIVGTLAVRAFGELFGREITFQLSGGWNTVLTATALCIAALVGGRAAVAAVARGAWRRPLEVRAAVAGVGGCLFAWFALVVIEQPLNWGSVLALLLVPVSFVAGAYLGRGHLPRPRLVAVVSLVGFLAIGFAGLGAMTTPAATYHWTTTAHGYEMIAPWWQDPADGGDPDLLSGGSSWMGPGIATINLEFASPGAAARFRDYRLEGWRAETPQDGWRLQPGQAGPFATAPASVDGSTVSGTIAFNRTPGLDWAEVVVTGVSPDGRRYLLHAYGPQPTQFYGSVASWFEALRP